MMRVFDSGGRLVLKAPMSQNRTFGIKLNVMEHKCLATAASRDEWIWNYILGHLRTNGGICVKRFRNIMWERRDCA